AGRAEVEAVGRRADGADGRVPPGDHPGHARDHAGGFRRCDDRARDPQDAVRRAGVAVGGRAMADLSQNPFALLSLIAAPAVLALAVGVVGASALVVACARLLAATRLSMLNMSEEAALIRSHEETLPPT